MPVFCVPRLVFFGLLFTDLRRMPEIMLGRCAKIVKRELRKIELLWDQ
jgi:hypothetical protein